MGQSGGGIQKVWGIQIFRNIYMGGEYKYFEIFVLGNTNISKYLYGEYIIWGIQIFRHTGNNAILAKNPT